MRDDYSFYERKAKASYVKNAQNRAMQEAFAAKNGVKVIAPSMELLPKESQIRGTLLNELLVGEEFFLEFERYKLIKKGKDYCKCRDVANPKKPELDIRSYSVVTRCK